MREHTQRHRERERRGLSDQGPGIGHGGDGGRRRRRRHSEYRLLLVVFAAHQSTLLICCFGCVCVLSLTHGSHVSIID